MVFSESQFNVVEDLKTHLFKIYFLTVYCVAGTKLDIRKSGEQARHHPCPDGVDIQIGKWTIYKIVTF